LTEDEEEEAKAWDVPLIIANPRKAMDRIMEIAEVGLEVVVAALVWTRHLLVNIVVF